MTIAAGFNCSDGILLCADTQYTTPGISKLRASKLFREEHANGARTAIAVIGNIAYARMIMQHIERGIGQLPQRDVTIANMRDALEFEVTEIHVNNLFKHPNYPHGLPRAQVLCAAWSPLDRRAALFWTEEAAINELRGYICVGAGEYLAHFLVRDRYRASMTEAEVRPIAIEALDRVKDFVDGCGGPTELVVLRRDGTLGQVERLPHP